MRLWITVEAEKLVKDWRKRADNMERDDAYVTTPNRSSMSYTLQVCADELEAALKADENGGHYE